MEELNELIEKGRKEREEGIERYRNEDYPELDDEHKQELENLTEDEQIVLLNMTMQSLRGSWRNPTDREAMIHWLCDQITTLPAQYLESVRFNAYLFNGSYIDGRIFRDGDRRNGLSGNLSSQFTGDDRSGEGDWNGTYGELTELGYPTDEYEYLSTHIPDDLTFSEPLPMKEEFPAWDENTVRWTSIENILQTNDSARHIAFFSDPDEEPTMPFGLCLVIRPEDHTEFVIH